MKQKEGRKKKMQTHLYQPGKLRPRPPLQRILSRFCAGCAGGIQVRGGALWIASIRSRYNIDRPAGEICVVYWRGNGHGDGGETGMRDEDEGRYVQVLVRNARDHGHAV
jgi:hypothetical protein